MSRRISGLLLALALCGAPATAQDDDAYVSEEHGFRIERPEADWGFQPVPGGAAGFQLVISHQPSGGTVQVSVRVAPVAAGRDAEAQRSLLLAFVEGKDEHTNVESLDYEILGEVAPAIRLDTEPPTGGKFRLRQVFLVRGGRAFVLQCFAPVDEFETSLPAFERAFASFAFVELSEDARAEQVLRELVDRCGSEAEWAESWADASARARAAGKHVLVTVQEQGGFAIADAARTGPLMDRDVLDLVEAHFVPLRYRKGMGAPFEEPEVYGLSGSTFGTALLIVSPDGVVRDETFTLETLGALAFLEEAVQRGLGTDADAPAGAGALEKAAWHLRRAEFQRVESELGAVSPSEGRWLRAELPRRLRRGEAALSALAAVQAQEAPPLVARARVAQAVVQMRMARFDDAEAALQAFLGTAAGNASVDARLEARYWLGALALQRSDVGGARSQWQPLVDEHPESRWAWKAAAGLTGTGFAMGYGERLDWHEPAFLATLHGPGPDPLPVGAAAEAESDALRYLLGSQRADGSWRMPIQAEDWRREGPGEFVIAVTALCARSLLPYRADAEAGRAFEAALAFLDAAHADVGRTGEEVFFMDYWVWAKPCELWLYAGCIEAGVGDRERLLARMEELVAGLAPKQRRNGGWSYLLTTELESGQPGPEQSISFTTAAVVLALQRAAEAGVAVPEEMLVGGLSCLENMRNADGTFEYMLAAGQAATGGMQPPGAAGRGPVCALPLVHAGREDLDALRRRLDIFVAHRGGFDKERGKALMHTGRDTQGSHYLMFDYATAAEAVSMLPEQERVRYRGEVLDQVLRARRSDGSYLDNPMLGADYATAMALQAFGPPAATTMSVHALVTRVPAAPAAPGRGSGRAAG